MPRATLALVHSANSILMRESRPYAGETISRYMMASLGGLFAARGRLTNQT